MDADELYYQIALTLIPQIGDVYAKELLQHFETAGNIFTTPTRQLAAIPGIGPVRARAIKDFNNFQRAGEEIAFIEKHHIQTIFYTDPNYPRRLKFCYDSPILLYYKGNADLNAAKILSVVGTRHYTDYGRQICEDLISDLAGEKVLIISGLAYGIDIIAHKAALKHHLPTVGVVAHGLDTLYPGVHASVARQMLNQGGLLTDFISRTRPDKQNFPLRNRIVAGMADATLVIETGIRGGSLITAALAEGYNRDVLAVPGRTNDPTSAGCNYLIRKNKAALVTCASDIMEVMGWEPLPRPREGIQPQLFPELNEKEKSIISLLTGIKMMHIDDIQAQSKLLPSQVAATILNLELQGLVRSLPGKMYRLA